MLNPLSTLEIEICFGTVELLRPMMYSFDSDIPKSGFIFFNNLFDTQMQVYKIMSCNFWLRTGIFEDFSEPSGYGSL